MYLSESTNLALCLSTVSLACNLVLKVHLQLIGCFLEGKMVAIQLLFTCNSILMASLQYYI